MSWGSSWYMCGGTLHKESSTWTIVQIAFVGQFVFVNPYSLRVDPREILHGPLFRNSIRFKVNGSRSVQSPQS